MPTRKPDMIDGSPGPYVRLGRIIHSELALFRERGYLELGYRLWERHPDWRGTKLSDTAIMAALRTSARATGRPVIEVQAGRNWVSRAGNTPPYGEWEETGGGHISIPRQKRFHALVAPLLMVHSKEASSANMYTTARLWRFTVFSPEIYKGFLASLSEDPDTRRVLGLDNL